MKKRNMKRSVPLCGFYFTTYSTGACKILAIKTPSKMRNSAAQKSAILGNEGSILPECQFREKRNENTN